MIMNFLLLATLNFWDGPLQNIVVVLWALGNFSRPVVILAPITELWVRKLEILYLRFTTIFFKDVYE